MEHIEIASLNPFLHNGKSEIVNRELGQFQYIICHTTYLIPDLS